MVWGSIPHNSTSDPLGSYSRGSIYTPIMELGSQNHSRDGLLGPNSILVVYMDPLGIQAPILLSSLSPDLNRNPAISV